SALLLILRGSLMDSRLMIMPQNPTALIKNTASMPNQTIKSPPTSGPITWQALLPTLLIEMALTMLSLGTSSGMTVWRVTRLSGATKPSSTARITMCQNAMSLVATRHPYDNASTAWKRYTPIRILLRSTRSATAPNIGANTTRAGPLQTAT